MSYALLSGLPILPSLRINNTYIISDKYELDLSLFARD